MVCVCVEDGIQIEPLLSINRLNYTLFFPNLEEAQLLASQLKQLKDYLGLKQLPYMK